MKPPRADLDGAVRAERARRLAALRGEPRQRLAALPPQRTEVAEVLGRRVEFTTCADRAHDGRLLVRVRSDEPMFLGLGRRGGTEAFWVGEDGSIAEAMLEDILDVCG